MDFGTEDAAVAHERALGRRFELWGEMPGFNEGACPNVLPGRCLIVPSTSGDPDTEPLDAVLVYSEWLQVLPTEITPDLFRCRVGEGACAPPGAIPYLGLAPMADADTFAAWYELIGELQDCDGPICHSLFARAPRLSRPDERALLWCETGRGNEPLLPRACSLVAIDSPDDGTWALAIYGWGSPKLAIEAGLTGPISVGLEDHVWEASVSALGSLTRADILMAIAESLSQAPLNLGVGFWPASTHPIQVEGAARFRASPILGSRWREAVEVVISGSEGPSRSLSVAIRSKLYLNVTDRNNPSELGPASAIQSGQYGETVITRIRSAVGQLCGKSWTFGNTLVCGAEEGGRQ